jgi:hypothetical protein
MSGITLELIVNREIRRQHKEIIDAMRRVQIAGEGS